MRLLCSSSHTFCARCTRQSLSQGLSRINGCHRDITNKVITYLFDDKSHNSALPCMQNLLVSTKLFLSWDLDAVCAGMVEEQGRVTAGKDFPSMESEFPACFTCPSWKSELVLMAIGPWVSASCWADWLYWVKAGSKSCIPLSKWEVKLSMFSQSNNTERWTQILH